MPHKGYKTVDIKEGDFDKISLLALKWKIPKYKVVEILLQKLKDKDPGEFKIEL